MIVKTRREGLEETVEFSQGKFISHKEKKIAANITGTYVEFYPDEEVLEETKFDEKAIKNMVREFSFLCKGLSFNVNGEEFFSKNGLEDYLNYLNSKNNLITKPIYFEQSENKFQLEVAIGYNNSYGSVIKLYTNNIPQEKGTHLTGFKTAWTVGLNTFARENKLLKEKDENLSGGDYEEGLILILNFKMIDPVFKGQNKEELSSSEGRTYVQKLTSNALKDVFEYHKDDIKIIIGKALNARKAREAAKKARDAVRQPKEKGLKAKMGLSNKFIDCISKNPSERNLLLVEGLSAGSAAVEARNAKTDCIYMLRGKIVSPLKQTQDKILGNQEMSDIIRIIGGGFGNDQFDVSKMNVDKVVITSDQDSDGHDIALLLTTFFYTFMRPLIEAGKLYRAVTPLYILRKGKEELYFYSDDELDNWQKLHKSSGYDILRCKG